MTELNLGLLSDAELADASTTAIAERDESKFLAVEAERARRMRNSEAPRIRPTLAGDALEAWRRNASRPRRKLVAPVFLIGRLEHASYRTLDFLYNAPEGAITPSERRAIEEEWSRRELLTRKWPYLTMRERHRLRAGLSTALAIASPFLLGALYLTIFRSVATAASALLIVAAYFVLVGFTALGLLPVLIGRVYRKLRGAQPNTARPDFRIGKTRATITASILFLIGIAGVLLGILVDTRGLLPSLIIAGVGVFYLLAGKPAASEGSFILWGKIHGRSKD